MELAASGQLIITADGDLHGPDTPENRDLARRIGACINACAGLSTEELEQGLIADLCRVLGQVAPLLQKPPQSVTERAA